MAIYFYFMYNNVLHVIWIKYMTYGVKYIYIYITNLTVISKIIFSQWLWIIVLWSPLLKLIFIKYVSLYKLRSICNSFVSRVHNCFHYQVRLTAQFVARNGRQFLTTLMNREQRNGQFDFLRPQHSLFQYFTKLLEQYTKVLIPPKDLMKRLAKEAECSTQVYTQVSVILLINIRY